MKIRNFSTTVLLIAAATSALLQPVAAKANTTRITELIGHPVVSDSGERLGNIEDFAIDASNGKVSYVVISIGSYLIEKSLIAVQPSALTPATQGEPIVLRAEDLEVAHRFNADNWPSTADVRPAGETASKTESTAGPSAGTSASTSTGDTNSTLSSTGTAIITAGQRKATFEGGKREIVNGPMRRTKVAAKPITEPRVIPNFKNLDRNRDGYLSRAEIGAELNQKSGFKDLDSDANGSIDDFEYAAYLQRTASERSWASNR